MAETFEGKKEKRTNPLRRFFMLLALLAAVLGIVVLAAYRDGTGFDVLRRYFNYGRVEKVNGGTVYDYDPSGDNRFAALGDHLVVLSGTSLQLLDGSGEAVWSSAVKMKAPALTLGGGRAAAYDVGGTELHVLDKTGELLSLTTEESEPIIGASLNEKGYLALITKAKNYKGRVSVYDAELQEVFAFNSSERFVVDAYVTDDGGSLAAVTLGQESSVFVSNVVLYSLSETEPKAEYAIRDGLVAALRQQGDRLVGVCDTCLTFASTKGELHERYDYGGSYLREFDLGGSGFSVLLLNRYQSGSVGRLVSVGIDGEELGSLEVNREILSLSAAGRYLAVLYMDSLVIYNQELQVYASLRGTDYARSVLMRPDGSALLLSSESASLFLP